jgi:hypothetical protein
MKTSAKRLLAVTALLGVSLCASPTDARKSGGTAGQTGRKSVRLNLNVPATIDVDRRDGKIVGMTAVMKDGSRKVLKAKSNPTCATGCPAGQTLQCWEDEAQLMSICECRGGGGGGGDFNADFVIDGADFQQ